MIWLYIYLVGIPTFIFLMAAFDSSFEPESHAWSLIGLAVMWPITAPVIFPIAIGYWVNKTFIQ